MPMLDVLRNRAWKFFWPVFYLAMWEILLRAQNPGLMTDDSGEIATASICLGIGHAPGYPLYILISRLAGLLPVGTPVFRLNLLASLFTLLAIHLTLVACRKLHKESSDTLPIIQQELWLVFTAFSLLFCESVFAQSLTAKGGIYTFTLMNFALMLWACSAAESDRWILWVLFIWSVGMGSHWPFQVIFLIMLLIRYGPKISNQSPPKIFHGLSFTIIGFSSFLYLPLRAAKSPPLNWENPRTLEAFWSIVSRRYFTAGEFASRSQGEWVRNILEFLKVMGLHWWPGLVLLGIAGAWFLFRQRPALAAAYLGCYAVLVAAIIRVTHFDTSTLYLETNYLVCTQALPALLAYIGAASLTNRWLCSLPKLASGVALTAVFAAACWGYLVFDRQQKSSYTIAEDLGVNLLKELPKDSLVMLDTDVTIMPGLYQRYIQGKRPDVAMIFLPFIQSNWGFAQAVAENKDRINPKGSVRSFQDAVRIFMDPSRTMCSAFFYASYKQTLEQAGLGDLAGRLKPWGLSYRLSTESQEPEQISSEVWHITSRHRLRNIDTVKNLPETEFTCQVYRNDYARPHLEAGYLLLKNGFLYDAVRQYQKALLIFPDVRGVYLNLALYFEGAGYLDMAEVFCEKEMTVAPDSADALETRGDILMKLGAWRNAADTYGLCLKINPGSSNARINQEIAMGKLTATPPAILPPRKSADEYNVLGKKFQQDGQDMLASVAFETARKN